MQVSKKQINKNLEKEIFQILYQLIVDLKNPEESKVFLEDILGKNETIALAKRLAVAYYLSHSRSYENIKQNLKVSSATISTIDKAKNSKGFELALKKIEAEKWASHWSEKIEGLFKRK
ncbi:MAG: YerC/YecD family TrpR-related protein [Patescibacteria group bacterium]